MKCKTDPKMLIWEHCRRWFDIKINDWESNTKTQAEGYKGPAAFRGRKKWKQLVMRVAHIKHLLLLN